MKLFEIDPHELLTVEGCDEAIAYVIQECADIEEQLEFPDEDATLGWMRRAKSSLQIGKGLKQRLQNRRGDLSAEIRHERGLQLDRIVAELCKAAMPRDEFLAICRQAEATLAEAQSNDGQSGEQ